MDGAIVLTARHGPDRLGRRASDARSRDRHRRDRHPAPHGGPGGPPDRVPVVSVSASMATISLYVGDTRRVVEQSDTILTKADQALQALERYRSRLWELANRLSSLEVQDQVTVRDFAYLAQRLEMVRRLDAEVDAYVVELGTDGRLLTLQLHDLSAGVSDLRDLLERDYRPRTTSDRSAWRRWPTLSTAELLEPLVVARTVGFGSERATRHQDQHPRLPPVVADQPAPHGARRPADRALRQSAGPLRRQQHRAAGGRGRRRAARPDHPRRTGPAGRSRPTPSRWSSGDRWSSGRPAERVGCLNC